MNMIKVLLIAAVLSFAATVSLASAKEGPTKEGPDREVNKDGDRGGCVERDTGRDKESSRPSKK